MRRAVRNIPVPMDYFTGLVYNCGGLAIIPDFGRFRKPRPE